MKTILFLNSPHQHSATLCLWKLSRTRNLESKSSGHVTLSLEVINNVDFHRLTCYMIYDFQCLNFWTSNWAVLRNTLEGFEKFNLYNWGAAMSFWIVIISKSAPLYILWAPLSSNKCRVCEWINKWMCERKREGERGEKEVEEKREHGLEKETERELIWVNLLSKTILSRIISIT